MFSLGDDTSRIRGVGVCRRSAGSPDGEVDRCRCGGGGLIPPPRACPRLGPRRWVGQSAGLLAIVWLRPSRFSACQPCSYLYPPASSSFSSFLVSRPIPPPSLPSLRLLHRSLGFLTPPLTLGPILPFVSRRISPARPSLHTPARLRSPVRPPIASAFAPFYLLLCLHQLGQLFNIITPCLVGSCSTSARSVSKRDDRTRPRSFR